MSDLRKQVESEGRRIGQEAVDLITREAGQAHVPKLLHSTVARVAARVSSAVLLSTLDVTREVEWYEKYGADAE